MAVDHHGRSMNERPACTIIAETAYLPYTPRNVHGTWCATLAGAEARMRPSMQHENGASVIQSAFHEHHEREAGCFLGADGPRCSAVWQRVSFFAADDCRTGFSTPSRVPL